MNAELCGESARDLNRMLLSEMRRAEKKTRIRAEWTHGDTVERFFDYVPKGTREAQQTWHKKYSKLWPARPLYCKSMSTVKRFKPSIGPVEH